MITVEGVYKDGKVELLEAVSIEQQSRVLVTFLENSDIPLSALGIDDDEAAVLRHKMETFEDWNEPAMDIYNDYDNARSVLNGGV